jgi:hypothetical protein
VNQTSKINAVSKNLKTINIFILKKENMSKIVLCGCYEQVLAWVRFFHQPLMFRGNPEICDLSDPLNCPIRAKQSAFPGGIEPFSN